MTEHTHMFVASISKNFVFDFLIALALEGRLTLCADAPLIRGKIFRTRQLRYGIFTAGRWKNTYQLSHKNAPY